MLRIIHACKAQLLLLLVALAGCSGVKTVQTFDAQSANASQAATLEVPGNVDVIAIDGTKMPDYLIEDLPVNYALLPGQHEILLSYSVVWANPAAKEDEEKALQIESAPQQIVLNAAPSSRYVISAADASSLEEARALESAPNIILSDAAGRKLMTARTASGLEKRNNKRPLQRMVDSLGEKTGMSGKEVVVASKSLANMEEAKPRVNQRADGASFTASSVGSSIAAGQSSSIVSNSKSAQAENVSRLEALKTMWQQMSKEEKKAFLKWAFQ